MRTFLKGVLWILSTLAIIWTVLAVAAIAQMGRAMGGLPTGSVPMGRGRMMPGPPGMMGMMGGGMMWMMLMAMLTWLIMLGLDGVFIYLIIASLRSRRST